MSKPDRLDQILDEYDRADVQPEDNPSNHYYNNRQRTKAALEAYVREERLNGQIEELKLVRAEHDKHKDSKYYDHWLNNNGNGGEVDIMWYIGDRLEMLQADVKKEDES